jgi:hypothetical protein
VPVVQPFAVSFTLSPSQHVVLSLLNTGASGLSPAFITIASDAVPQIVVQVAVYVPDVPTMMLVPLAPVFQVNVPLQPLAVKVAVSPAHRVGLLLVTIGAVGVVPVVIVTTFEVPLVPQLLIHTAL